MNAIRNTILVAGSANLDFVVRAPHVPAAGETVLGGEFATFPGGKGANQAVAAARAGGIPTQMLLALGCDAHAAPIEASLRAADVQLHVVRVADRATGTAFICVSDAAENAITVAPGANQSLRREDLPPLDLVSHLLLQLETPLDVVEAYAMAAQAAGVCVVLNAAPACALSASMLRAVDVLIVNEGELAGLGVRGSLVQMLAKVDVDTVIVTLGERGCCARAGGRYLLQPAFAVELVDTTGAGDTFCGALVAALSGGSKLVGALRFAAAASALACTRLGAQASIPTHADVVALLQSRPADSPAALDDLAAYCGIG